MKVTRKSRLIIRLQNIAFVLLFLTVVGLLGWLSTRYTIVADWTQSGRNTLSEASVSLLKTIEGPLSITAFVRQSPESTTLRGRIEDIIGRYQRHKPDINLGFVNPDIEPQLIRDLGISVEGELLIRFGPRKEKLQNLTEQGLTNAIQRVVRSQEKWAMFLEGHGERSPRGQANHDVAEFVEQLKSKGIRVLTLNLARTRVIPDNTSVLVIASPQVSLLASELRTINDYIERGGSLLWLSDPDPQSGPLFGMDSIAEKLGIEFYPGTIVEPATQTLGIDDPRFALVTEYPSHGITANFNLVTLFPQASGIDMQAPDKSDKSDKSGKSVASDTSGDWTSIAILMSSSQSWSETGEMNDRIQLDRGSDIPGPLTIGVALTRDLPEEGNTEETSTSETTPGKTDPDEVNPDKINPDNINMAGQANPRLQRIVVIGDGDFISNGYLGNGGNLDLGLRIVNWLSRDDDFISIPAITSSDQNLQLGPVASGVIGIGFLLVLPLILLATGIVIWVRRRKR
ncbi:MAG: hypothetical protein BMS9Abin26_0223 [Gammaproteobacteria bacterium]|nr:MAG: hypothetical protein BMS9Abin26_0223 [Gammaproteobacteria bacterium]